jgi:hypothetical protein
MRKTNFDQSSTGLNIELSIFKDTDQSGRDFKECVNIIQQCGYRQYTIAAYTDFGNIDPDFDFNDPSNYDFTKKDLIAAMKKVNIWDQETAKYKGYDLYKATKQELIDFAKEEYNYSDFAEFLENFTPNFIKISTRGNCQGDFAEVIFSKKVIAYLEKECNKPFSELLPALETTIDNLFWDSPIYARLTVNGEEYYLDGLLPDLYDYDRDLIADRFIKVYGCLFSSENLKIIVDFLSDNLPEYPDYQ